MLDKTQACMKINDITPEVLIRLNIALAPSSNFSEKLEKALGIIGEVSHHDRIQIIEIHQNLTYTITHSWNKKCINEIPEKLKHGKLIYETALEQQLCTQNHIIIHDTEPLTNPDLAPLLQALNCRQMLLLPLFESGSQFAFIAFVQCEDVHEWNDEEIKILRDISSIIALQLNNFQLFKHLTWRIQQEREARLSREIRHNHLCHWYQQTQSIWEQFKNKLPDPDNPELISLEQHFKSLDKICHPTPVK